MVRTHKSVIWHSLGAAPVSALTILVPLGYLPSALPPGPVPGSPGAPPGLSRPFGCSVRGSSSGPCLLALCPGRSGRSRLAPSLAALPVTCPPAGRSLFPGRAVPWFTGLRVTLPWVFRGLSARSRLAGCVGVGSASFGCLWFGLLGWAVARSLGPPGGSLGRFSALGSCPAPCFLCPGLSCSSPWFESPWVLDRCLL